MTFEQVKNDIRKLVGIELKSIKPGANITIIDLDESRSSIQLQNAQGIVKSRPLSELKYIWDKMQMQSAVHVDEVLHGSGTSRNQPETILANLPYVEWTKVDNKKHIVYVAENTHPFGTIKQMDPMRAAALSNNKSVEKIISLTSLFLVTDDVTKSIRQLQDNIPGTVSTLDQGIYLFKNSSMSITVLHASHIDIEEGSYVVLNTEANPYLKRIVIFGQEYSIMRAGGINALIKCN